PPTDKRNFEKALSKDSYTFGFELGRNRQGQVEIARLVPGGAAWKSQEINKGDLVTEVRFASGQVLDLICASLSDLTSEIEATDSRKLTLEIQKAGGLKKTVTLIKEKMSVEDNTLDSFILKGEKKVGYIYLPGFYTQFEDGNALGCANDVAKELLMLQIEGIEGLILDLRFNGGGSMEEAIDLAGLFIDEGPIAMTNTKEGKVKAIRDMNRGVTYEGPLMVLVNGLSASASELFAASIQDYHRGLIVGTTTYGKATGQIIVPLHPSRPQEGASVKVTNFKFYRVTGDSHQAQGVVPDLEIPDPWRELVTLEVDQPSVIARDQVQKELVYDALPPISVGPLKSKSQVRIAANPYFQVQGEAMKEVQKVMDQGEHLILHPGGYGETLGRLSEIFDAVYDPEVGEQAVFVVDNNRSMATVLMLSENLKLRNDQVKEKLLTDIQLQEAFQV
ncbi:MAG: S41 family peptidase, partial [Bacteroidota bacterium]